MMTSGYNIKDLVREAQIRWLKPGEVLFILQHFEENQLTNEPPQKPPSGSLFLFNKRVLRFFRKDGHSWRRQKDGGNVREARERIKVGNVEALNCCYAHGELNPNFQRRSYWMLDPSMDHIVLVHYRDISMHHLLQAQTIETPDDSNRAPSFECMLGDRGFSETTSFALSGDTPPSFGELARGNASHTDESLSTTDWNSPEVSFEDAISSAPSFGDINSEYGIKQIH